MAWRRRHFVGGFLLTVTLLPAAAARAEQPPQGVIEDLWYVMKMGDSQCGSMHATTRRQGDEILSDMTMEFGLTRGDIKIEMEIAQSYRETVGGKPVSFEHTMKMGQMPQVTRGTVRDGRIELVTSQFGADHKSSYPFDPEIRFPWAQIVEQRRRGLVKGTTYEMKTYDSAIKVDGPIVTKFEIGPRQSREVLGEKQELTQVTTTIEATVPIVAVNWVDDDCRPIMTSIDMGMFKFDLILSTKEKAKARTGKPELFFSTFVDVEKAVNTDARKLVLRLKVPPDPDRAKRLPDLPETDMQKFKRVSDHEAVVTITRLDWDALRKAGPGDNKAMSDYLKAAPYVDINDENIRKLARKAIKDEASPAERADALRKFVTDYVRHKGLDTGFATAQEVARNRRGDCSEHGVLLAALARCAGLPSRGVSGLVLVPAGHALGGGKKARFGYHMWTQVYIDGKWVDIDAAMRQTDCDPTHIALALMSLNDENLAESVLALMPLMGRLQIDVVSQE